MGEGPELAGGECVSVELYEKYSQQKRGSSPVCGELALFGVERTFWGSNEPFRGQANLFPPKFFLNLAIPKPLRIAEKYV